MGVLMRADLVGCRVVLMAVGVKMPRAARMFVDMEMNPLAP